MITIPTGSTASQALDIAARRGLLPTSLGSREVTDRVAADILRNAVFSAKTTNAAYLSELKQRIERLLQGGRDNDKAQIRWELKQILRQMGYTPEKGFPGDEALGIEPAEPGSLQDLSSDRRLNLILETQEALMRGAAQKMRGEDGTRRQQFPAWELVRIGEVEVPRDWQRRWFEAGGDVVRDSSGGVRLMALKGAEIWGELGARGNFDDALNVEHPPFAFNSGMGWREIHWLEWEDTTGPASAAAEQRGPTHVEKLEAAYKRLRERTGYDSIPIGDVAREAGVEIEEARQWARDLQERGDATLDTGDWSYATEEQRRAAVEVRGQPRTLIRRHEDAPAPAPKPAPPVIPAPPSPSTRGMDADVAAGLKKQLRDMSTQAGRDAYRRELMERIRRGREAAVAKLGAANAGFNPAQPRDSIGRWTDTDGAEMSPASWGSDAPDSPVSDAAAAVLDQWTTPAVGSREGEFAAIRKAANAWVKGAPHPGFTALHRETQRMLAQAKVKTIKAYRGVRLRRDHPLVEALRAGKIKPGQEFELSGASLTSWSDSGALADSFSSALKGFADGKTDHVGVVLERDIPAADVVASYRTQSGFLAGENEILGRMKGTVKLRIKSHGNL